MDDHERHGFIQPPGPPMFGRGSPLAGPDPKRRPDAELAERVRRHEDAAEAHRKVDDRSKDAALRVRWWRRLLRRPSTG
jgi:hypothetical protein